MPKTTVRFITTEKLLRQELKLIRELGETEIEEIAKEFEKKFREYIKASLQRPGSTGNLAKSFFASKIPNGWGVGDIEYLNANAPYWAWINYGRAGTGRTTPPATAGFFSPGNPVPEAGSFRQGRFFQAPGQFFINPTKPIQAHNYIARTLQETNQIISGVLARRRKI